MSVACFLFVAILCFVWGRWAPLEIQGGTSFECAARVDKPPYAYWKNRRLIDVQVRVHDIKPACKNAVSVSKRMVFSLPARFAASPLLAKGQPLIIEFGRNTKNKPKVTTVRSGQGTLIADLAHLQRKYRPEKQRYRVHHRLLLSGRRRNGHPVVAPLPARPPGDSGHSVDLTSLPGLRHDRHGPPCQRPCHQTIRNGRQPSRCSWSYRPCDRPRPPG